MARAVGLVANKPRLRGPAGQGIGGPPQSGAPGVLPSLPGPRGILRDGAGMGPKQKTDPVTDGENALKKLRENPGDKRATEALERALQRLKERDKQNATGELPGNWRKN